MSNKKSYDYVTLKIIIYLAVQNNSILVYLVLNNNIVTFSYLFDLSILILVGLYNMNYELCNKCSIHSMCTFHTMIRNLFGRNGCCYI